MKTAKTTFVAGIIFVLMALMTLTTLTACGGSGGGHGHPSAESDDPVPGPVPEPGPPTLKAIPEDGKITVWIPDLSLSDYTVFWSYSEDGEPIDSIPAKISDSDPEMLEATITGLENGTRYWVWVVAGGLTSNKELCTVTDGKTWYVRLSGDDNNDGLSTDAPLRSVPAALQKVKDDKAAYPDKWADPPGVSAKIVILDLSGNIENIEITLDETYPPITLGGTSSEDHATISGTLTINGTAGSPAVTLAHVTLDGGGSGDVVTVSGGKLVIETGAVIKGGGNGVVINSGGAVNMTGGSVQGNAPNGVQVSGGTFNLSGGRVGGNTTTGVNISSGAFNLSDDGVIGIYPKGDTGGNTGSGVVVSGGAAEMSGGRIWSNGVNGVEMTTGGAFNMTGGEIGANTGDGVYNSGGGVFTKSGGGTVYGKKETDELKRNGHGSIGGNPNTYGPNDNYPAGQ